MFSYILHTYLVVLMYDIQHTLYVLCKFVSSTIQWDKKMKLRLCPWSLLQVIDQATPKNDHDSFHFGI